MTILATCPKGHELTLEERLAGKKIRCPRCKSVFLVPDLDDEEDDDDEDEAVSEKPLRRRSRRDEDDDEEDDDRPRRRRGAPPPPVDDDEEDEEEEFDDEEKRKLEKRLKKKQLKLVHVGLLLHYIKLWMYVVAMLLGMVVLVMWLIAGAQTAGAVAEAGGKADNVVAVQPGGGVALMGVALFTIFAFLANLFVALIGPLLGVVGSFLCCFVPKKSHARGTIITSFVFDLVSMVAWLLGVLAVANVIGFDDPAKKLRMIELLRYLSFICIVSSWLTFFTYLRGLGAYLGEPGVGNEALNLIARLVVQVISLVGNVFINVACAFMLGGVSPILGILVGIAFIILWMIFFIFTFFLRLLKLITAIRRAVDNKL